MQDNYIFVIFIIKMNIIYKYIILLLEIWTITKLRFLKRHRYLSLLPLHQVFFCIKKQSRNAHFIKEIIYSVLNTNLIRRKRYRNAMTKKALCRTIYVNLLMFYKNHFIEYLLISQIMYPIYHNINVSCSSTVSKRPDDKDLKRYLIKKNYC